MVANIVLLFKNFYRYVISDPGAAITCCHCSVLLISSIEKLAMLSFKFVGPFSRSPINIKLRLRFVSGKEQFFTVHILVDKSAIVREIAIRISAL